LRAKGGGWREREDGGRERVYAVLGVEEDVVMEWGTNDCTKKNDKK